MKWAPTIGLALSLAFLLVRTAVAAPVAQIEIKGPIGPGVSSFVSEGIKDAQSGNYAAILLIMDTPGGLDSSMREIIQAVLDSRVPVIGYVAPSGARAASAGTYILMACHIAAMAPGTTIGAATPIAIGGSAPGPSKPSGSEDSSDAEKRPGLEDKIISDSAAYMRALAKMRGRPVDWAEKFVREAASVSDSEALDNGIIEFTAASARDLLIQIDGRVVTIDGKDWVLETMESDVIVVQPTWRDDFLAFITNPNIAYLLLLVGIYGFIFEFSNPGLIVPGIVGGVALILGLYALHLLPVNYAGLALIGLGLALITTEAFLPSFGVLGIGGIIAFVLGSILLFDTDIPGFQVSGYLIGAVALVSSALALLFMAMAVRAWRRPVVIGVGDMSGITGTVIDWKGQEGHVQTHGEVWMAKSALPLAKGEKVRVKGREGLLLEVESAATEERKS